MAIIKVYFPENATEKELNTVVHDILYDIEQQGGKILSAKPIERIDVSIIGREFQVDYNV